MKVRALNVGMPASALLPLPQSHQQEEQAASEPPSLTKITSCLTVGEGNRGSHARSFNVSAMLAGDLRVLLEAITV
jgi:hypothetical protein